MMSFISSIVRSAATRAKNSWALLLILAVQLVGASPGFADPAQKRDSSDEARIAALAKQWFVDMQQGKVDRSQYAPAYAAQITDGAVQAMSGNLNRYGAPPLRVEIAKTRKIGGKVFYVVKFVFPSGEATALTFGFDASGKITGVAVASTAGD
jgi:hypothetical protein